MALNLICEICLVIKELKLRHSPIFEPSSKIMLPTINTAISKDLEYWVVFEMEKLIENSRLTFDFMPSTIMVCSLVLSLYCHVCISRFDEV